MTPTTLTVVTANIWRGNPQPARDVRTLYATGADIIAFQEAAGDADTIVDQAARAGYQVTGATGRYADRDNPVALHDDITVHGTDIRTLSDAVGDSPIRKATCVRFEHGGRPVALINFHANSHVQEGPADPRELPRVREYTDAMRLLEAWVRELRAAGYAVVVVGDLNWAWTGRARQWKWSPEAVFARLGMVTQYDHGMLPRPRGDARAIEYIAWHPADARFVGQRFVTPEKSDHPFHETTLTLKEKP